MSPLLAALVLLLSQFTAVAALGTASLLELPTEGTDSVVLSRNAGDGPWTAIANASWLHLAAGSESGTASTNVIFTFDTNAGATRTGTLTIAGETLAVTQAGRGYTRATSRTLLSPISFSNAIVGLTVASNGDIFYVDRPAKAVRKWTRATAAVSTVIDTGLRYPNGLAVDADGNLYIADQDDNTIKKWSAATEMVTPLISTNLPYAVALDRAGNVYFTPFSGNAVSKWDATTQQITPIATGLDRATAVAVDFAGNVYFNERNLFEIRKWSVVTQNVSTLISSGLDQPEGLAVDATGSLYMGSIGSGGLKKYSAATQTLTTVAAGSFDNVALDLDGNLYVADAQAGLATYPQALVSSTPQNVPFTAGSSALPPVLPLTQSLAEPFLPTSDSSWLTVDSVIGSAVQYSRQLNTDNVTRTGHVTVLGIAVEVIQALPPPAQLTYSANPASYEAAMEITANVPSSGGGAVDSYSVNPPLPVGLFLVPDTGIIGGTPPAVAVAANYTITATNGSGSTTAMLNLAVIDTTPPTIEAPTNGFTPLRIAAGPMFDYRDQPIVSDSATGTPTVTQMPAPSQIVAAGPLTVMLTATDASGNSASLGFAMEVRPAAPASTLLIGAGAKADGGGGTAPGNTRFPTLIPTDAKFSSLGQPAINEDGLVVFVGKWTSATGPKGTGLFTTTDCLAAVGSPSPIAGANYKSFSDPVISRGTVAFVATLTGVPAAQSSVLVSGTVSPLSLAVVAQSGKDSGSNGATYQRFRAVQVFGDYVGYLAELTPKSGNPKTTAATGLALFVKIGMDPAMPILRQGDTLPAGRLKTLVSFATGAGSPGQGRGWLTDPYGFRLTALGIYEGKPAVQEVISAFDLNGGVNILSRSGSSSIGAPDISGATFQSYGLPTANNRYGTAFLASLTPGGTITKQNQRGIFFSNDDRAPFVSVARVTDTAPGTGATFSVLKDPVLAEDRGLAFPANVKEAGVKGAGTNTLWWKPPGRALQLLSRGGPTTAGVPDVDAEAEWTAFPSLAIAADRGPLFIGTLRAGRGNVTKAQTSGVWATDFLGDLRLLFQTGVTQSGSRTLKSFQVLKAVTGSPGVGRSYNDAGQVVWLATFTDGSTAIMRTQIP